jgi:transcriptional regulator with XRE-family HTH domain
MDSKSFGSYMKEKREQAGFQSMEELARASKVSAPTIFRIENDKTKEPGHETLKKLCAVLNLDYEDTLRRAGFLPKNVTREDLPRYISAVEDFNEGLTPAEAEQMAQYKRFIIAQRKAEK